MVLQARISGGENWKAFIANVKGCPSGTLSGGSNKVRSELSSFARYKKLIESCPLDDKKIAEGVELLLHLFSERRMDKRALQVGINSLFD